MTDPTHLWTIARRPMDARGQGAILDGDSTDFIVPRA